MSKSPKMHPAMFVALVKEIRGESVRPTVRIPDKRNQKKDKADRREMRQYV